MQIQPLGYLDALVGATQEVSVVDVLLNGVPILTDIPTLSWSVEADSTRWVRRSATVKLPAGTLSKSTALSRELRIRVGPSGSQLLPVGTLGVQDLDEDFPGAQQTVTLADRGQRITDDRFPVARTLGGNSVVSMIRQLVKETVPWADLAVAPGVKDSECAVATWDRDRDEALKKLAATIGAQLYCDPYGDFRLAPIPGADADPVWSLADGDGTGLIGGSSTVSRRGVFNAVIAYSTGDTQASGSLLSDGITPLAADLDPSSPTYVFGPFGRVTRFLPSPFFINGEQCDDAGRAYLNRVRSLQRSAEFSSVSNVALEPDDAVSVDFGDGPGIYLVQSISFASMQPMRVRSRTGVADDQEGQ